MFPTPGAMGYVWIGLIVIAAGVLMWSAVVLGWAVLASRAIGAGVISWDELGAEQAELPPLAAATTPSHPTRR